ncbi:craniofacial development protein 2-like [Centruroides vittatus]|uniref:craniofacial development protein 2-like n=1 Tax=Centruroides vittatus TaxID=120091 RepID=UPI00350FAE00
MEKDNVGIAAIQEIWWRGNGILRSDNYTILYSAGARGAVGGTGFLVANKYKAAVLNFKPVNDRPSFSKYISCFFNITFVCVYAPMEGDDDDMKDAFHGSLEQELGEGILRQDVKIVLGDFNVTVGREEAFRETVGKESLHDVLNDNGQIY